MSDQESAPEEGCMSAEPVFDEQVRNAVLALRGRIRFEDGRPYDARCSRVAAKLQAQFGWKREWGRLRLLDGRVCWQHCWNRLADGRLLDATADQFEACWLGDIVLLEASDPRTAAYQPAPPGWTFTPRERAAEIELVATRDGRTAPEAPRVYANWMESGRSVLTMMTGWRVPDDLVDYTARILQVRALLNQSITSGDLDGLLSMYELAHAAAARGGPWMSSEYAALLPGDARLRAASGGAPP